MFGCNVFKFVFIGGFYSQKVSGNLNLRIISLNTNLYYGPDIVTLNKSDPANQFEWLENTLTSSQQNNEKVDFIDQNGQGINRGLNLCIY